MKKSEIKARLEAAKEIAFDAGKHVLEFFNHRSSLVVQNKGHQDFVTEADKTIEQEITQRILSRFPGDTVFGEEMGGIPSDATWVIDPIDGTTNFIHGIAYFCVSIAFIQRNIHLSNDDDSSYSVEVGVIYDPVADELFSATRGNGAFCNDNPIKASTCDDLSHALIGIGYSQRTDLSEYSSKINRLLKEGCEYRRFGSAALMLAHVADGRMEAYYEKHLNSWDALAGLVIIQEAGAYGAPFLEKQALKEGNVTFVCADNLKARLLPLLMNKKN
ncbi:MAG: inositol monophosphatase [Proteobacteria bacterium]|nr:inositol monophosphatase [Pseudomonadota bacterium]